MREKRIQTTFRLAPDVHASLVEMARRRGLKTLNATLEAVLRQMAEYDAIMMKADQDG